MVNMVRKCPVLLFRQKSDTKGRHRAARGAKKSEEMARIARICSSKVNFNCAMMMTMRNLKIGIMIVGVRKISIKLSLNE